MLLAIIALPLVVVLALALLFSGIGNATMGLSSVIAQLTGPLYLIVGIVGGGAVGFIGGFVFHAVKVEPKRQTEPPALPEALYPATLPTPNVAQSMPIRRAPVNVNLDEWGF